MSAFPLIRASIEQTAGQPHLPCSNCHPELARSVGKRQGYNLMVIFKDYVARPIGSQFMDLNLPKDLNELCKPTQSPDMLNCARLDP